MARAHPKVSVVMPVYNGARYLDECVESVLGQSYTDLELVVVDDGSSDESWAILERAAEHDDRIVLHRHDRNQGHHVASNRAIELARGEYIARMDQDDVVVPGWLATTVEFFERHPEVGLVTSAYIRRREGTADRVRYPPTSHTALRTALVFGNRIPHTGVTVRATVRATGELHYNDLPGPQDYDLWVRLLARVRGHTLETPLVVYREHGDTMTALFADEQPAAVAAIVDRQLEALVAIPAPQVLAGVRRLHALSGITAEDQAHVDHVLGVYDAMRSWPDLDGGELDEIRRDWIVRALSTLVLRRSSSTWPTRAFLRALWRADPAAFRRWAGRDLVRRVTARLRAPRRRG